MSSNKDEIEKKNFINEIFIKHEKILDGHIDEIKSRERQLNILILDAQKMVGHTAELFEKYTENLEAHSNALNDLNKIIEKNSEEKEELKFKYLLLGVITSSIVYTIVVSLVNSINK